MIAREFSFELLEAVVSLPAGTLNEQLFPVLHGLFRFYVTRSEHNTSRSLG